MSSEREIKITGDEKAGESEEAAVPNGEAAADEVTEPGNGESPQKETDESPTPEERIAELEGKLLLAKADLENYRKRSALQAEESRQRTTERVLSDFLDIFDNLELALKHAEDDADVESVRKGTQMIFDQVRSAFERYAVTPIEAVGERFDPNLHEAMLQLESDEYDEGVIVQELSRGYRIGNRVLRHSKVAVSSGKPSAADGDVDDGAPANQSGK